MSFKKFVHCSLLAFSAIAVVACAAMTTLPDSKLQETASAIVGKKIISVTNIRHSDDMSYYDAHAVDGTTYACSLQVVMGFTSQHQKCEEKK